MADVYHMMRVEVGWSEWSGCGCGLLIVTAGNLSGPF